MKKFVSEAEIEEKRKKRQEEWEKVRQPHQPEGKNTRWFMKNKLKTEK